MLGSSGQVPSRKRAKSSSSAVPSWDRPASRDTRGRKHTNSRPVVYLITNPVWPGWFKVGKADRLSDRLNTYQTGDPHRSYEVLAYVLTDDPRGLERIALNRVPRHSRRSEWFKAKRSSVAISLLEKANHDHNERKANAARGRRRSRLPRRGSHRAGDRVGSWRDNSFHLVTRRIRRR
ncbi:GIY-YIG nuclease family protein [Enhydrobacter aerosaccus]|uniref:GIY-YIG nuclease family protein n=1 Tax=Enhydrobacter aerosaccus TaxID=225324 RepID=UPI000A2F13CB